MMLKRVLYLGYMATLFVVAALVDPILKVVSDGFRYLSTLDVRVEQALVGIVQSLKNSFGDRWRSAKAFKEDALAHDKFDGNQFTDACPPAMQC